MACFVRQLHFCLMRYFCAWREEEEDEDDEAAAPPQRARPLALLLPLQPLAEEQPPPGAAEPTPARPLIKLCARLRATPELAYLRSLPSVRRWYRTRSTTGWCMTGPG